MDYATCYSRLIERARWREVDGYTELHHVVPKCIGTDGDLVRLTAEEHYLAHLLLVRMHPDNRKLVYAAVRMTQGSRLTKARSNKMYGWLRRRHAEAQRAARTGTVRGPHRKTTREKMRAALIGRPKSEAHRAALARAKVGARGNNTGTVWTPEMKLRMAFNHGRLPLEVMMKMPLSALSKPCRELVKTARINRRLP